MRFQVVAIEKAWASTARASSGVARTFRPRSTSFSVFGRPKQPRMPKVGAVSGVKLPSVKVPKAAPKANIAFPKLSIPGGSGVQVGKPVAAKMPQEIKPPTIPGYKY